MSDLIEVMLRLGHWLKRHNIDPQEVRLVLEFDRHCDNHHAEHALMAELEPSMVDPKQFTGHAEPKLCGIRYKFTNGHHRERT
jgi:hypothetical protein